MYVVLVFSLQRRWQKRKHKKIKKNKNFPLRSNWDSSLLSQLRRVYAMHTVRASLDPVSLAVKNVNLILNTVIFY